MKFIAIIPARAGSKRLPHKNMLCVDGIPLVVRALHCAQRAGIFDEILVTTDAKEVVQLCRDLPQVGVVQPKFIERPEELATGTATSLDVARHAAGEAVDYDAVMLLQPTSPQRDEEDIRNSAAMLNEGRWDAVVSMTDVGRESVFCSNGGIMCAMNGLLRPNGAIYILRARALLTGDTWFPSRTRCYYMENGRSIDIDTVVDLEEARGYFLGKKALENA